MIQYLNILKIYNLFTHKNTNILIYFLIYEIKLFVNNFTVQRYFKNKNVSIH